MNPVMLDELVKISISLLIGSVLGFEREYRNKPAGFRTIALICIGSTLYTLLSARLGNVASPDRVAANIITGIGFIGAGVIFKNDDKIFGLTTAATIWVAAGLGMAVGTGAYLLALTMTFVTMVVLSFFEMIQQKIEAFHTRNVYVITLRSENAEQQLEAAMKQCRLAFKRLKKQYHKPEITNQYEIFGKKNQIDTFDRLLSENEEVLRFEH